MLKELLQHRREVLRALANHHYEEVGSKGLLFPRMGIYVGGGFHTDVNGKDQRFDDNIVVTTGLNKMLDVMLHNDTQVATWYVAPFVLNVAPTAGLTGATFDSTLQELTEYNEATRPAYVEAAAAGGITTNAASKATFTINGTVNNWGLAILSTSTKEDTVGLLFAAVKYAAVRALQSADVLSGQYAVTLTSS